MSFKRHFLELITKTFASFSLARSLSYDYTLRERLGNAVFIPNARVSSLSLWILLLCKIERVDNMELKVLLLWV